MRMTEECRKKTIQAMLKPEANGPAFGASSKGMQVLILQVLLSIDARLDDIIFYLQNQEERAQNQ